MNRRIISAIFDNRSQAERAMLDLRAAGISDDDISMLQRGDHAEHREHGHRDHDHDDRPDNKGSGAAKGAGIGAGVGAIAGLTALAIPGVGPFLALGAVAETLGIIGSAAATSAVVGAAAGGISGALMDYGVEEDEARDYDRRLREGGVWLGVDASSDRIDPLTVRRILSDAGGETSRAARTTAEAH